MEGKKVLKKVKNFEMNNKREKAVLTNTWSERLAEWPETSQEINGRIDNVRC